jgi:[acyl-carrier-protein] S-malonyltransferase
MGRALAERSAAAREVFARVDAALGRPLSALCFGGDPDLLTLTANQQPAVLAVGAAALAFWRERGRPEPDVAAGHSLGEYTALLAAGTLDLEDAARLVALRGRLMQEAVPAGEGGMAAVIGVDAEAIERVCAAEREAGYAVWAANFNGGGQVVLSGRSDALARAGERLTELGARRIVPLPVSAPFHTPLMGPAARRLRAALDAVAWRTPRFPVVANVDARPHPDAASIPERLERQVTAPVLWEAGVRSLSALGVERFVEFEPGTVLTGLLRRIDPALAPVSPSD